MREIKFRAWDVEEQYMYECVSVATTRENKWITMIVNKLGYITSIEGPYELMQYTGLKVNGDIELYEGDIVPVKSSVYFGWKQGREHFKANAVVVYDEKEMRYRFLAYTKDFGKQYVDFDKSIRQSYKIIGNIYENPELLEETK